MFIVSPLISKRSNNLFSLNDFVLLLTILRRLSRVSMKITSDATANVLGKSPPCFRVNISGDVKLTKLQRMDAMASIVMFFCLFSFSLVPQAVAQNDLSGKCGCN